MGSKQVSPLDQWDMVRIMWDCRLSTLALYKLATSRRGGPPAPRWVLFLDPLVSIPSCQENARELLFPNPAGGFRTPWASCSFPASTAAVPAATVETPNEDQSPTSLLRGQRSGGSPMESLSTPLDPTGYRGWCTAPRSVHHAKCTVNKPACIFSAMYSVIN